LWARLLENLVKFRARIFGDLLHLYTLLQTQPQVVVELVHIGLGAI
jgi:hypothetical protein